MERHLRRSRIPITEQLTKRLSPTHPLAAEGDEPAAGGAGAAGSIDSGGEDGGAANALEQEARRLAFYLFFHVKGDLERCAALSAVGFQRVDNHALALA